MSFEGYWRLYESGKIYQFISIIKSIYILTDSKTKSRYIEIFHKIKEAALNKNIIISLSIIQIDFETSLGFQQF